MTRQERRRQANGHPIRVNVSLTLDQYEAWQAAADADDISLQRWMVDHLEGKPPTMIRRALLSQVTGIRHEIRGAMSNLSALGRAANMARIDLPGWADTVEQIRRQNDLLDVLVDKLS